MAIDRVAVLRNAEKLLRQGKLEAAIADYVQVVEDQPGDWNTANLLGDLYLRAGQRDKAVEQFVRIAESLKRDGFLPKAAAVYKKVLKILPGDDYAMLQTGDIAAMQGLLVDARAYWTSVAERRIARGDTQGAAEIQARLGTLDSADFEARTKAARARIDRGDRKGGIADLVAVASDLIDKNRRNEGLEVLFEAAIFDPDNADIRARMWEAYLAPTEAAAAQGDWAGAAATLQEFVSLVPNHVQALTRLVEICFDGGLDQSLTTAQSELAEAYLATGAVAEARVIAEDLMAREPSVSAHVDQLRRALTMQGESDPDAVIAERMKLAAEEPADESRPLDDNGRVRLQPDRDSDDVVTVQPFDNDSGAEALEGPGIVETVRLKPDTTRYITDPVRLKPDTTEHQAASDAIEHQAASDVIEIDLSDLLQDFGAARVPLEAPPAPGPPVRDLDQVFERFREEVERGPSDPARDDYERALELRDGGRVDESMLAFEAAARDPRFRFRAGTALGQIHRARGALTHAVEWLERAAQAPPPGVDDSHALFYELAEILESQGECARALAICLELQADAGDYRDVSTRIHRLSQLQARG